MSFDARETAFVEELEQELNPVEAWPAESPLAFVVRLAPRTRGKLGEELVAKISRAGGIPRVPSGSADFDRIIDRPSRRTNAEIKFSTEDPPRFQQVRNPRQGDGYKYDSLVTVSGRPEGFVHWICEPPEVARMIDGGELTVQHQDSETHWFFPDRSQPEAFSSNRRDLNGVLARLRA